MATKPIIYWNREAGREEAEKVYGASFLSWLYETRMGRGLPLLFLTRPFFSSVYGRYQDSWLSRRRIGSFIRDFRIPMEEFEGAPFNSFNEFFIRRFRPNTRPFVRAQEEMPAFAEGRYLAFEKTAEGQTLMVKGLRFSLDSLMGNSDKAKPFAGGPLFIVRLCPSDYHRFHFPDEGIGLDHYRVAGQLHSVNPVALHYKEDILATNERQVSLLQTKNFGQLATIEVGALCVGKIVQSYPWTTPFIRGAEKGYFLFGGSTIALLGEPGAWRPDADLLKQTARGLETLVKLGTRIAARG